MKKILIILLVLLMLPIVYYGRYRFYKTQPNQHFDLMIPQDLEGYTDKLFFLIGDTINVFVRANTDSNLAIIKRMTDYQQTIDLDTIHFDKIEQEINNKQSEFGCNWEHPIKFYIDSSFEKGYYNIQLKSLTGNIFEIYFLVGDNKNDGEIAYLSNVSTWNAYNYWGGKSLYKNAVDDKNVYYVSTLRPNVSYNFDHNIDIEANGFYWLKKQNYNVDVYPDYILEQNPKLLENKKVIVLPYHAEYFSFEMYSNLEKLIYDGRSLLALGANQIYWKIKWRDNFTLMECRKDLTFFDNGFLEYGGMWKHKLKFPERFLGTRYTQKGLRTFAPYKVVNAEHFLYSGLELKNGDTFGLSGADNNPLSGIETDKVSFLTPSDFEVIAKGLNPVDALTDNVYYPDNKYNWSSEGGGDFMFRKLSDTNAILNSGAIHSVSGLGYDNVFTTIISNFLNRYLK